MINRRQVLSRAVFSAPLITSVGSMFAATAFGSEQVEDVGVASGDPTPSSVSLWTRVPEPYQSRSGSIPITCFVSTSEDFSPASVVLRTELSTDAGIDFTVRHKVEGLAPDTHYYYMFKSLSGYQSVIGRTKTAPAPDSERSVRFAVVSCQNFSQGYFLSYHAIAAGNFDFILHLGDFIYEKGDDKVRQDNIGGGEATTLEHYRAKYKLYLTDPYLKEARRLFPFVHLWDDHEVVNNYAGPDLAASDRDRMEAGYQAFFEYNPVNGTVSHQSGIPYAPMTRALRFGSFFELFALDQRQFRDPVVCGRDLVVNRCADALLPDRTMLGLDQGRWMLDAMANTDARWKFIASELMMMPVRTPSVPFINGRADNNDAGNNKAGNTFLTLDSWDGYPVERQKLLVEMTKRRIKDVVVCSGDIHNFFAGKIHQDPDDAGSPAIASELTTASITSKGIADYLGTVATAIVRPGIARLNAHIQLLDLKYHGHIEVEVGAETVSGRMIGIDNIQTTGGRPFVLKEFTSRRGIPGFTFS